MACACGADNHRPKRREACRWLALTVLAAGVGVAPRRMCAAEGKVVANLSSVSVGTPRLIPAAAVILVRSATGLAALSTRCTHQNRRLEVDARGRIVCPGHNAVFANDGRPVAGPATRRLTWHAVEVDKDGNIRVDTGKTVTADSWAPLPDWAVIKC